MRNTFLAHRLRVTATAPAFGTMQSVPDSVTALWIAICTPEWTVPISTSTLSRLIRRSAFCRPELRLGFVVELDELDLAAAELAALFGEIHLDRVGDVLAELRERARIGQHQPDLDGLRLSDRKARRERGAGGERGGGRERGAARNPEIGHGVPPVLAQGTWIGDGAAFGGRFPAGRLARDGGVAASKTARTEGDQAARVAGRGRKGGRDLAHEAVHLLLDLAVRLQADIEIEDDLVEARGLDLLQGLGDRARACRSARSSRSGPRGRTFCSRSTMSMK